MATGFQAFKEDGTQFIDTSLMCYGLTKSAYLTFYAYWPRYTLKSIQLDPDNGANYNQGNPIEPIYGITLPSWRSPIAFLVGDGSPCGECASCKAIAEGRSMNVVEIDAASNNGVDNIREIVNEVAYSPTEGKYRVYIIDEVHMLSAGAFNALLKTLEEPPSYVIFILATTEANKIPVTILSRCQRYDFKRLTVEQIEERMKEALAAAGEELPIEEKALKYLAKSADGAMRDAWSLLDQCLAFHFGHELTYDMVLDVLGAVDTSVFSKLLRCVIARDVAGCIGVLEEIVLQGRDMSQFVSDFTWYLRNLLLVKTSGDSCEEVIDISSENLARLKEEAQQIEVDAIMRDIRCFSELSGRIRYAGQKRVLIEMALIRLCRPEMETNEDTLLERIRKLEQTVEQIESGSIAIAAAPTGQPAVQAAAPVRKAELPKAVPEEIKEIVAKWPRVAGSAQQPMKSYLKNARLSLGGDNRLLLVVEDGLASDYFTKEPANKGALEQLLAELTGKQIEVEVRSVRSKQEMESSYVDLTRVIHMDIEEE